MARNESSVGLDLFCGVGGMSLGFEQAGFHVLAAFDSDSINVETYCRNFPGSRAIRADLSKASGVDLRHASGLSGRAMIDVVFGGPPCQGFSLIGRRDPEDARNRLIFDFVRLVGELEARYFVMENVAGLQAGKARQVLDDFVGRAEELGYAVKQPIRTLCASDFGVPQCRERVFVLGGMKGLPLPNYPPAATPDSGGNGKTRPTVWDAIGDLPDVDKIQYLAVEDVLRRKLSRPSRYAAILTGDTHDPEDRSTPRKVASCGLTGCMRTQHSANTIRRFAATSPGASERVSRFHRLKKSGLANTLRAGTGPSHGSHTAARPIHPVYARCITVREAARLHSFPDWFVFHATKWHGFQQVGNAVPPRLARAVAKALLDVVNRDSD
jgi:DNA (cytosine-5)-methyltransferase 1